MLNSVFAILKDSLRNRLGNSSKPKSKNLKPPLTTELIFSILLGHGLQFRKLNEFLNDVLVNEWES